MLAVLILDDGVVVCPEKTDGTGDFPADGVAVVLMSSSSAPCKGVRQEELEGLSFLASISGV